MDLGKDIYTFIRNTTNSRQSCFRTNKKRDYTLWAWGKAAAALSVATLSATRHQWRHSVFIARALRFALYEKAYVEYFVWRQKFIEIQKNYIVGLNSIWWKCSLYEGKFHIVIGVTSNDGDAHNVQRYAS